MVVLGVRESRVFDTADIILCHGPAYHRVGTFQGTNEDVDHHVSHCNHHVSWSMA